MISAGEKLPEATFKTMTPEGAKDLTTSDIFSGKRVVLFGVPGAFTPGCSNTPLPGNLENHEAILAKGVDSIAVVAVNDHYVMGAWAKATGGEGKILFLADGRFVDRIDDPDADAILARMHRFDAGGHDTAGEGA